VRRLKEFSKKSQNESSKEKPRISPRFEFYIYPTTHFRQVYFGNPSYPMFMLLIIQCSRKILEIQYRTMRFRTAEVHNLLRFKDISLCLAFGVPRRYHWSSTYSSINTKYGTKSVSSNTTYKL
jgi:hypothetical protein